MDYRFREVGRHQSSDLIAVFIRGAERPQTIVNTVVLKNG
jgi:hypothetical protein